MVAGVLEGYEEEEARNRLEECVLLRLGGWEPGLAGGNCSRICLDVLSSRCSLVSSLLTLQDPSSPSSAQKTH